MQHLTTSMRENDPRLPKRRHGRNRFQTGFRSRPSGPRNAIPSGLKRRAAATVELAICLPVLLTLTLATVDLCSVFFLKETITIAAYEGARRGVNRGGTNAAAAARTQEVLAERSINDCVITFEGSSFDSASTLEHVTYVVEVPVGGNLVSPAGLYGNLKLTSRVTMRKEFENQK